MEELEHINGGDNNDGAESDNDDVPSLLIGILEGIRDNNPTVTSLELQGEDLFTLLENHRDEIGASVFCKKVGDWIANNTHLRELAINVNSIRHGIHSSSWDTLPRRIGNYHKFLMGVAQNKSISQLKLRGFVNTACNSIAIRVLAPLFNNKRICKVSVDDCSDRVLQQLSSVLYDVLMNMSNKPEYTLKELKLHGTNDDFITDHAAASLITILSDLHCVETLTLNYTTINEGSSHALSHMLKEPDCTLKELTLEENEFNDEKSVILAEGIRINSTLETLNLRRSDEITGDGWTSFFNILRPAKLGALSVLYLCDNNINDEAAAALSHVFTNNNTLQNLFLSEVSSITTTGWQALANLVHNPDSALYYIDLNGSSNFDDDALLAWVNALSMSKNATLLSFLIPSEEVTSTGWLALENLVCNKTTIDTLYDSNHVLGYITQNNNGTGEILSMMRRIAKFRQLSQLSGSVGVRGYREVALYKIIRFYFMSGEANMKDIWDMELNIMVHAIARIGCFAKDNIVATQDGPSTSGHTLLYQIMRSVPSLFDVSSSNRKNRKVGSK